MRSRTAVGAAHERAAGRFGRIDVLVNNAGIWIEKPFLEFTDEEWHETLVTIVTGV